MSVAHFPHSHLSSDRLEKLIALIGEVKGLEFRLPTTDERPDSVSVPWVSFFENQIESGLRLPPSQFFLVLPKIFGVPLNQFNLFSLR